MPEGRGTPEGPAGQVPTGRGEILPEPSSRADHLRALEKEELRKALESAGWVIARAARVLGWTPRQVAYKMKKHSLKSPWK
ncbi:MAG: helix-turn-helix domain-containing protein [Deltaproteobacteria bacterium]|nr:helix-turn-helix domain-containing protein [Deltaproteobacteria bacterium]